MIRPLPASVCVCALLTASAWSAQPEDGARGLLAGAFKVTRDEMARLDAGQVVSRTLDTSNAREVATLGIVRMRISPDVYVERFRDIVAFKRTDNILEIGRFGDVPAVADLGGLTVEERDLRELRDCRVGDCGVRLSADGIERIRRQVDPRAGEAARRTADVLKGVLVDYVTQYQHGGRAPMMIYADREKRFDLSAEFASLVDADSVTWRHVPALRQHLVASPAVGSPGISDFIYWSKERVHRRPVISLTHVAIAAMGGESPIDYAIASKQIYAMHYFDASLGLTLLLRDRTSTSPATYVVYLNRTRIDLFDGLLGSVARRVAAGKARSLVGEQLARLQRTLAAPSTASATAR